MRNRQGTALENLQLLPASFFSRHTDQLNPSYRRPEQLLRTDTAAMSDRYDLLILDCAAGMSSLAEAVFKTVDSLVIPTMPSKLSARSLQQLRAIIADGSYSVELRPVLSMVDRRRKLHRQSIANVATLLGPNRLPGYVPYLSAVEQMAEQQTPLPCMSKMTLADTLYSRMLQALGLDLVA
mgnify:CR=1 FL=1